MRDYFAEEVSTIKPKIDYFEEEISPQLDYGLRADRTKKGMGFLGEIKRPDGGVSTELSIGVNIDGKEIQIPTLIPTLDKNEIDYLIKGNKPTREIVGKAIKHAQGRISQGESPFANEISTKPKIDYFAQEVTPTPEQPVSIWKETIKEIPTALKETLPETARGLLQTSEQVAGELSRPLIYASTVGEQIRQGKIKNIREAIPFMRGLEGLEKSSVAKSMKDIAGLEITGKKGVAGLVQDATVFATETGLEFYLRPEYLLGGVLAGKLIGLGTTAVFKGATHLPKSLQNILFKDMKLKLRLRPQTIAEIAKAQTEKGGVPGWIIRNKARGGKYAKRAEAVKDYLHQQRMTPEVPIEPTAPVTPQVRAEVPTVPVAPVKAPIITKPTPTVKAPVVKPTEVPIKPTPEVIPTAKVEKPAEVVKPKIEPIKKYKTQLTEIKGEIVSGEAGYRMPVGIEKEEWIGVPSTYPEYFKNKGWTKKQVVTIINKAQTGKPLTTKQQGILSELTEVAKEKRINLASQIKADRDIQRSKAGVLSDKELDSIIKEPKQEEDVFKYMAKEEKGFIKIPSYQPAVDLYNRVHDWIFTFGEARRTNPELYDKLMKSYGRRNAGIERSVSVVENVVGNKISTKDAVKLSLIYEDKRLSPPKELKPIYDKFNNLLTNLQKREIAEGIFKRPFQERMLEENEAKLEIAKSKSDYKTMRELSAENTKIKNMRYLPHNVVVQRAIEAKLAKIEGVERKAFLDKLSRVSYQFRIRKGRGFLADYIKSGLLKPEDADIRKLTAEALSGYYYRSSLKSLFDYAKSQELIKPTSEKLKMQGWLNQRQIGIVSPELKNKLIHPLLATSLTEMKTMKQGMSGGIGRRILGMIKIGQFIKPQIIWNYNAVQKYMKGIYGLNPVREAKDLAEAYKAVTNQTELYHKLSESNLYQFPYEVSRTSRDEQIKLMIRKTSEEIPNYVKLLERLTNTSWAKSDIDIKNTLMVAYQALAKATWFGDKVQRTQSYLTLRNFGYPHDEAVKVASHSHGAYSILSEKYKKTLSPITFVYSFRLLMPMEIAKIVTEPVRGIAEAIFKREKIPKYKAKRWTKSLIAAILIPVLIDSYMKARGFKKEGVHLGSLAWKWKKDVVVDGKKSEIVVGMNYILNMPIKYIQRATYYNPIRPQSRIQQAVSNLIKWEVHPLGRIFFWDLKENRRSFGSGTYVYDANAHWVKQTGQLAGYVFGQSFRFWGGVMDAMGEGNLTTKEKVEQEKIFNENLSNLDRVLFSIFGYKYTRQNLPDRKAIMRRYLEKEWFKRGATINRKYEGERKIKQLRELEKWKARCMGWINNDMR